MNNGTKSANIMTWNTYRKKFNPTLKSVSDSSLGTKSVIEPTMRSVGFTVETLYDVSEDIKPIDIVKDNIDIYSKTYIVYHPFKYRDGSGKGIFLFYA